MNQEKILEVFNYNYRDILDLYFDTSNNLHDSVKFMKPDFTSVWGNKAALNYVGVTMENLKKIKCYKLYYNFQKPCTNCPLKDAIKFNKPVKRELEFPDGIYTIRVYPTQIKNERYYIVIALNITREKELNNKLENEKLKNDVLMNLSNEFRTPLNLIHSTIQLLDMKLNKSDINIDDKYNFQKYLSLLTRNNYRLMKLVNNLLDLNEMDSGYYHIDIKNRDIVAIIKEIVTLCKGYANKLGKDIEFKSDVEEKIIAIDSFEIETLIINLLSNAIKYTEQGDEIFVNIKCEKGKVIIAVKDSGIGIPEDKQEGIFDKFHRLDISLTRKNEGSGLGLAIVKLIVEMHNGELNLYSKPGVGSKFIIKLPDKKLADDEIEGVDKSLRMVDRINIEFSDIRKE